MREHISVFSVKSKPHLQREEDEDEEEAVDNGDDDEKGRGSFPCEQTIPLPLSK